MNAQEIRKAYLVFLVKRDHKVIPRALLVPQDDPTTLFTGSGMQPLIPYLLGEPHPKGTRLVNSQTCIRVQDIEEVGDNRHTTFFEMLGNWSLGDYFKREQINWFWEFLTEVIKLDPQRIFVTCYSGNKSAGIPKDTESAEIWKEIFKSASIKAKEVEVGTEENGYKVGEQDGRIFFYSDKNWWSREGSPDKMSPGEPGGPDTEVFYLYPNVQHDPKWGKNCHPNCECGRYIELGNSVFMEYVKAEKGFDKLPKQNVDYGGGLERIAAAAIDSPDVFKISLLWPIIEQLQKLSGKSYNSHTTSMRVIADHLRGAVFLAVDGVVPSNKEQGYVMRRLIRRAIRFAFDLGIEQNFLEEVVPVIADVYHHDYPEVAKKRQEIIDVLSKEEKVFRQTLRKGLQVFDKVMRNPVSTGIVNNQQIYNYADRGKVEYKKVIEGKDMFLLYDTYGFPLELIKEEAFIKGIAVPDESTQQFEELMEEQRERSRTASKGEFKGGLGGHSDIHKKYHTATHLMYKALRMVLGDHVIQRGSNITEERLRFDFSHPEKVTPEQIAEVERIVNDAIDKDYGVTWQEYPTKKALEMGALGAFGDRYGETVKVYKAGLSDQEPFSFEICGGPHVDHTAQLGEGGKKFKITKEEASSAGIRRIKAVLV